MAILSAPGGRSRPGYAGGRFYLYPRRGALVGAVWPRSRGRRRSLVQQDQIDKFTQAALLYKYLTAREREAVEQAVKDTPYLARDLHFKLIYGTMFYLDTNDGRRIYPLSFVSDVSIALDAIGQIEGDILLRGPDLWSRLPIGPDGQVLTAQAGSAVWAAAPGAGPGAPSLISLVDLAGSPQATIDVAWGASYDEVRVFGWFTPPASGGPILIALLSSDAGSTWQNSAGQYALTRLRSGQHGLGNFTNFQSNPDLYLSNTYGSSLATRSFLDLSLLFPSDASTPTQVESHIQVFDSAFQVDWHKMHGLRKAALAHDALRLKFHDNTAFRDAKLAFLGINWFS